MQMENIKINHKRPNYWQVIADTKRFGEQEILFEGISFEECIAYIEKENKRIPYIAEVQDAWNSRKIWHIKHTKCRHYLINQMVAGKMVNTRYTRTTKAHVMEIITGIQKQEKADLNNGKLPKTIINDVLENEYKLALVTGKFAYYVCAEESDENGNTMIYRIEDFELLSDNIFATNSLIEEMENIYHGKITPKYISPMLQEEIKLKAEIGWFDE